MNNIPKINFWFIAFSDIHIYYDKIKPEILITTIDLKHSTIVKFDFHQFIGTGGGLLKFCKKN